MNSLTPAPRLHRRVRHLRLGCHDAAHARRARILLEDALRTASIDDAGRLILVRRLDLGSMPLRASATSWSQRLEQRLAGVPSSLVGARSPAAANASAVYFASAVEPWFFAAERAASGTPCHEWFWPLALPEWRAAQPASVTLAQAFRVLADRPDGLLLTIHLARRLAAQNTLSALLAVLTPELVAPLALASADATPTPSSPDTPFARALAPASATEPTSFSPPSAALVRFARTWGRDDPRTRWLATVLAAPALPAEGFRFSITSATASALPSAERVAAFVAALYFPPSRPSNAPIPPPAKPTAPDARPPGAPTSPTPQPRTPPASAPAPDRRATSGGGLLFLLPLFERAGLPAHLDTLPPASRAPFISQLFHLALRHARVPADDPLHEVFTASAQIFPRSPAWFLLAAARLARRRETWLRELIRRPALVSATSTHLDVFFRPGEADLRIRRAGLDLDPGWLPWLGLVVRFHYTRED